MGGRFTTSMPFREIAVSRFGGLFTEADPRDIPSGAASLAQDVDFLIAGVTVRPGLSQASSYETTPGEFQFVKQSYISPVSRTSGVAAGQLQVQLAQDTNGALWMNNPADPSHTGFYQFYTGILNSARMLSFSANESEYICLSDFLQGTDQPRRWDGTNLDRVSQCGPCTAMTATPTTGGATTDVAAGTRYAVVMYLTRSGFITQVSPPVKFTTATTDTGITFANICTGPSNVLQRIIAITPADAAIGGPYYYVPAPDNNPNGNLMPATIIYDNTSTTASFALSDTVLQAGIDITAIGNNRIVVRELGEPVKGLQYAGRSFYMGCRSKVDTFLNLTFDGGTCDSQPISGWTETFGTSGVTASLKTSPIFGQSLYFKNGAATYINTGNPTDYLSQSAYQTWLNTDILQQDTEYGARITVWTPGGNTTGKINLSLYSASLGTYWTASVNCSSLAFTPQEFVVRFGNPAWATVPTDLELLLWPSGFPPGADFEVDRIEIFDVAQPVLNSQVQVSYAADNESFDQITGVLDISSYTADPITNIFRFLNTVYIATTSRWFSTVDNGTGEPSTWTINELSNSVGCLGPMCDDAGEEWVMTCDLRGIFLFDGGNHIKVSQEIQQLWELQNWNYLKNAWLRLDRHQQRIMVGVTMDQPTSWTTLPSATPTKPNVILECSYLMLATGSEAAVSPGVRSSSFTGMLLDREGSRKWAVWSIPAWSGNWIVTPSGEEQFWLCSSAQNKIYHLDSSVLDDDGAAIPEVYQPFGFSDEMTEDQLQLGSVRKLYSYGSFLMDVTGTWNLTLYPETPLSNYPVILTGIPGQNPAQDDTNVPMNITANRVFPRFQPDGTAGHYFSLYRMVLGCMRHPRIPLSGVAR